MGTGTDAEPPQAAFVRATYDPGHWVIVVVRPGRQGATATVFDVVADLRLPAPTLWGAISTEAHRRGVRLPQVGATVVTAAPGVREWRDPTG